MAAGSRSRPASIYNDRIRGIIEGAGITDFVTYLETDRARHGRRTGASEFGDERDPQMREYLHRFLRSPGPRELKKPTLILHPAKDIRVPVGQAQELVNALKENNATVWYAEFADAQPRQFPEYGREQQLDARVVDHVREDVRA